MNQLTKVFEGKEVRMFEVENEPWFVASDVCGILGLSNPSMAIGRLDEDERSKFNLGRQGEVNTVNEFGLYTLILGSRKAEAKKFKRWVTHEVIPSIRKHGGYLTPDTVEQVLSDPDTIIRLATNLKEERSKRQRAEMMIEQQKPKVLFADAVATSETSVLIGQLAKLITQNGFNIGQNRMFAWLRENDFLGKSGSHYNEPTQYAMERGWFEVKERTINNPDGSVRITRTTKVTGKGQVYFINKFLTLIDVV
ncbi:phage antirepressor [Sporosarcina sp. A2]|uniref:phage antirepressor n=1 Tax=Sporosarcina sp. A2 TaxID=3393449 RepID=UPI003D7BB567